MIKIELECSRCNQPYFLFKENREINKIEDIINAVDVEDIKTNFKRTCLECVWIMVETAKVTNTRGKGAEAHYVEFETQTGRYTLYLDWGYDDKLIITVWDDDKNLPKFPSGKTLFDQTITLERFTGLD